MKLRNPKEAPHSGGWYFIAEDGRRVEGTGLRQLVRNVEDYLSGNGMEVPSDIAQIVEDQICERLGKKYCFKGFGDHIATAIQAAAGVVDAVAGTELQVAAKKCGGCGRRKRTVNRLTS